VALRRQVVNFVRLHLLDDADQVGGVGQVAVVENQIAMRDVRILVEVVDAIGIEQRGAALDAVNDVAFFKQKFGEIGTILAGDPGNQCSFAHCASTSPFARMSHFAEQMAITFRNILTET